eukprot:1192596-Prorocentrum_minimum.AAC.2
MCDSDPLGPPFSQISSLMKHVTGGNVCNMDLLAWYVDPLTALNIHIVALYIRMVALNIHIVAQVREPESGPMRLQPPSGPPARRLPGLLPQRRLTYVRHMLDPLHRFISVPYKSNLEFPLYSGWATMWMSRATMWMLRATMWMLRAVKGRVGCSSGPLDALSRA